MNQTATLKQVAYRAGVSLSTASLVLNGRKDARIAEATRRRVWQAARELNYRGRASRRRRLHFVAAGTPQAAGPYERLRTFSGAQAEAERRRASVQVVFAGTSAEEQLAYLASVEEGGVDGLLIAARLQPPALEKLVSLRVPAVLIGSKHADVRLTSVHSDNQHGMTLLMEHLFGLGHRRIAFCGGTRAAHYEDRRCQVFEAYCLRAGLAPPPEWFFWAEGEPERLLAWAERLLSRPYDRRPTAILASKEAIGRRLLAVLDRLGCRIPRDVSVVMFDDPCDSDPDFPSVTCIRRPVETIARVAVARLLEEIENPDLPRARIVLPVELLVRQSSGPPAEGASPRSGAFPGREIAAEGLSCREAAPSLRGP